MRSSLFEWEKLKTTAVKYVLEKYKNGRNQN